MLFVLCLICRLLIFVCFPHAYLFTQNTLKPAPPPCPSAGVGGLFDYGPIGCTLKENFLAAWRRHFVLEEDMLEIATVCMTPEVVLKCVRLAL